MLPLVHIPQNCQLLILMNDVTYNKFKPWNNSAQFNASLFMLMRPVLSCFLAPFLGSSVSEWFPGLYFYELFPSLKELGLALFSPALSH